MPVKANPYTRHRSQVRGITYRVRADGSRTYSVYCKGSWVPAGRTLEEARVKQSDLIKAQARGEKPILTSKITFGELADEWLEAKLPKLRPRTADQYKDALRLVLQPRWGSWRLAAIDADAISNLVRDLQREGLHAIDKKRPARPLGYSSVQNYLLPAQAILAMAVRRRLISSNPFRDLTADDRPVRGEKRPPYEWAHDALDSLIAAAEEIARRPTSRYDYSPLLRLTARLGLRCGEVLGLQWGDFDKDASTLTIARQWTRYGEYAPPKTAAGSRRIALPGDLREELIALRLRSSHSADTDPIFASRAGTPLIHRNVTRRGFEEARDLAGLPRHVTFHDLRDAAASKLIAGGLDPVTVATVLGHEDPHVTLKVYAHLFDRRNRDEAVRTALAAG